MSRQLVRLVLQVLTLLLQLVNLALRRMQLSPGGSKLSMAGSHLLLQTLTLQLSCCKCRLCFILGGCSLPAGSRYLP